jgi:hypothetical protein
MFCPPRFGLAKKTAGSSMKMALLSNAATTYLKRITQGALERP